MLRAKLRAPALPAYYIHRQRLHDLLEGVLTHPLTAVIAPAGSGKTLLVSGWIAGCRSPAACGRRRADRDPSQFWRPWLR
jgi:LuxR family maltose regulon positive regulatory protein